MTLFRTDESMARYREHQKAHAGEPCPLCKKEAIKVFKKWKIMKNDFPYDLVASKHNMLLPIRHVTEEQLDEDEKKELLDIKANLLDENYDFFMEAAPKTKSIPDHFHLHLIVVKESIGTA